MTGASLRLGPGNNALLKTAVCSPPLARSSLFIPESAFYAQSVMLSLRFIRKFMSVLYPIGSP